MKLRRMVVKIIETRIFAVPENLDVNEVGDEWMYDNETFLVEMDDDIEIEVDDEVELSKELSDNELAVYNRGHFDMDVLQSFFGYGSLCNDNDT